MGSEGILVEGRGRSRRAERALLGTTLGLLLLLWLPVILHGQSARIGSERHWWLGDDAMISMTYARNLAQGHGLVWRPDELVEGYTNFLWTFWMGILHLLPIPTSKISLAILGTNLILSGGLLVVLQRLIRLLGGGLSGQAAALGGMLLARGPFVWGVMGFETVLLSLLVAVTALRIGRDAHRDQPRTGTYWLAGAVALVRADALVLTGLLLGMAWLVDRRWRLLLPRQAPAVLLPAAHLVFRLAYYGQLLPNTARLKATGWEGRTAVGLGYIGAFAREHILLLLLVAAGVILLRRRLLLALSLVCVCFAGYVAVIGGDAFEDHRFLVPILPLLLAAGTSWIGQVRLPGGFPQALAALAVGTMPLLISGYPMLVEPSEQYIGNLRIALLIRGNTATESTVAVTWAGVIPYFSERPAVDLLGKSDPVIAGQAAVPGLIVPGHNKFDFEYSLGVRRPDLVVSDFKLPVREDRMQALAKHARVGFMGRLYFHPIFREQYLPNPVGIDEWHSVFVADWSREWPGRDYWGELE